MGILSKAIRKAAVKVSVTRKAIKIAPSNLKAAYNFKTGKTVRDLLPVVSDTDSLAYHVASKANKRGIKQSKKINKLALRATATAVAGSAAMTVNNFRKATPEERQQAYAQIAKGKQKLADGYKMVYGKIRRVRN